MPLNVGSLVAYLSVDDSGVDKGLSSAEKKMSGASGRLAGLWSGATKSLAVVGAGLTGLVAASAGVGIKTAANMEQANIAFTTMLGSGQKAQDFLKQLNQFAAKTPFDFPGLTTAASSLISAGIDANKVIPIMTSLGNATSGMGTGAAGVQRATVALQQMSAAGKISGEDLNQLRDAGVPVFDLLTAATGKTTAQIADMAQKGQLGRKELDQLMTALENGKGLERFNGLMEQQSQSLSGMLSTLKDTANMGLAQAFAPAIPFLKEILTDANTLLTASLPGITVGVGKVTAALQGVYDIFVHGQYNDILAKSLGVQENSPVVGFLFRIRDALAGIDFSAFGSKALAAFSGLGQAIAGLNFARIGDEMRAFGKSAGDSTVWTDSLRISASLLGTVLGFLSDHAGTIIRWMPVIVAGFAAWKIAQQALMVIEIARIPLLAAQVAASFANAAANTALALSQVYAANVLLALNGVTRDCFVLRLKDAVVANAQAVATGVVTAATWLQAAATRALGAAMTFATGPIGVAIAIVGVLALAFIYAYKHSETFRDIVNGVWSSVKDATEAVVDWFTGTAWPAMQGAFKAIGDAAVWLWTNGIQPAWDGIRAGIDLAIFLIKGYINVWVSVISWLVDQVVAAKNGIVDAWNLIRDGIGSAVGFIRDRILVPLGTFVTVTVPGYFSSAKESIGSAWDGIKGKVSGPIDWVRQNVFDPWKTLLTVTVPGFFSSGVSAIGTAWDKLKDAAKTPVRFLIDTVVNGGIIDAFNWVADKLGVDKKNQLSHFPMPKGFSDGGYTGMGGRRQPMGVVHGDEHVIKSPSRRKFERAHPGALDHLNRTGELPGYTNGGVVALGKWLQGQGARVSENSAFGGTTPGVHHGAGHAGDYAIDANYGPGGTNATETAFFNRLAPTIRSWGYKVLWQVAGHFNHLHAETQNAKGGGMVGDTSGGGFLSSVGDFLGGLNPVQMIRDKMSGVIDKIPGSTQLRGILGAGPEKLIGAAGDKLKSLASSAIGSLKEAFDGDAQAPAGKPSANRSLVQALAARRGWGDGAEWSALDKLVQKESSYNNLAQNPSSTAYGLFQFLNGTWAGTGYKKTPDPATQTAAGLSYISSRYGDPIKAWAYHLKNNSYDSGGIGRGKGMLSKQTLAPERVLSPQQTVAFERLVTVLDRDGLTSGQSRPKVEKHLHYYAATGRSMPEADLVDAAGRAQMLGW